MAYSGTALAAAGIGAVFLYGGIKGKSPLGVILAAVKGQNPGNVSQTQGISLPENTDSSAQDLASGNIGSAYATTGGSPQAALQNAAALYGWSSGAEWQALNNIEMHEAGYSPTVANTSSGALGLAQALGHGKGSATAGTLGNEYGGYGLSNAQAKLANSGDADMQALWMVNYIKSRYGTPSAAWAQYHHADGTNWY